MICEIIISQNTLLEDKQNNVKYTCFKPDIKVLENKHF